MRSELGVNGPIAIFVGALTSTYDFGVAFNATFYLLDEAQSAAQGRDVPFNVSSATGISFQVFCPDGTEGFPVNTTNYTAVIDCDYTLLRFSLDFSEEDEAFLRGLDK
jgi:hypothetical protein